MCGLCVYVNLNSNVKKKKKRMLSLSPWSVLTEKTYDKVFLYFCLSRVVLTIVFFFRMVGCELREFCCYFYQVK